MNADDIKKQLENVRKLTSETKVLNSIFDRTMDETLQNAPDSDKKTILEVKEMTSKAFVLAKEGNLPGALEILKTFKNGG